MKAMTTVASLGNRIRLDARTFLFSMLIAIVEITVGSAISLIAACGNFGMEEYLCR